MAFYLLLCGNIFLIQGAAEERVCRQKYFRNITGNNNFIIILALS